MIQKNHDNLINSIHQRLLNLSYERKQDFNLTLIRYVNERLLYRLSQSEYANRFILKGATLFTVWTGNFHRPTRDLDLLGFGDSSEKIIRQLFHDICLTSVEDDGLKFDVDSIHVSEIREEEEYNGQRVKLIARLGKARIAMQIDVGFGDSITPKAEIVTYPTLLNFPPPILHIYPKETVIAEKFQTMVARGFVNSRMKDFYDLWVLSKTFDFNGELLTQAIQATFKRRKTIIPATTPLALTTEFYESTDKKHQWLAFVKRSQLLFQVPLFPIIITDLQQFLQAPLLALQKNQPLTHHWSAGGPWTNTNL